MQVVAATRNPTEPWGRRPYHRPDCSEVTKQGTVQSNWTTYPSVAAAKADGRRPCKRCQP
jgi:methylphosphotriester-DNA--protein-cysteine methyltransferase